MYQFHQFTDQQCRLIADLRSAWSIHADLERSNDRYSGGMSFKRVNGNEYLVRYFADPTAGKKRFVSLGRRTPAAETNLAQWHQERDRHRREIAESSERVELLGRMAKALRLARFPAKSAGFIRKLSTLGLAPGDLAACGSTALYAYELEAQVLSTPAIAQDDRWDLEMVSSLAVEPLEEVMRELLGPECQCFLIGEDILVGLGALRVVVHRVGESSLEFEPRPRFVIGRDAYPLLLPTVDQEDWLAIAARSGAEDMRKGDRRSFVLNTMTLDWTAIKDSARVTALN